MIPQFNKLPTAFFLLHEGQTAIADYNIFAAADGWRNNIDPVDEYGPIIDWDTSSVTIMGAVSGGGNPPLQGQQNRKSEK